MNSNVSEFENCPNCAEPKHLDLADCPYCGVVYVKAIPKDETSGPQVAVDIDLLEAWQNLLKTYDNIEAHEVFLQRSLAKKKLAFASQQYRRIIEITPTDEIAKKMQERIIQLASIVILQEKRPEKIKRSGSFANILLLFSFFLFISGLILKQPIISLPSMVIFFLSIAFKFLASRL